MKQHQSKIWDAGKQFMSTASISLLRISATLCKTKKLRKNARSCLPSMLPHTLEGKSNHHFSQTEVCDTPPHWTSFHSKTHMTCALSFLLPLFRSEHGKNSVSPSNKHTLHNIFSVLIHCFFRSHIRIPPRHSHEVLCRLHNPSHTNLPLVHETEKLREGILNTAGYLNGKRKRSAQEGAVFFTVAADLLKRSDENKSLEG